MLVVEPNSGFFDAPSDRAMRLDFDVFSGFWADLD